MAQGFTLWSYSTTTKIENGKEILLVFGFILNFKRKSTPKFFLKMVFLKNGFGNGKMSISAAFSFQREKYLTCI